MKLCVYCAVIGTLLFVAAMLTVQAEQRTISEKLIRLHIVANSDSEKDQTTKLKVRDAVVDIMDRQSWSNIEEARSWITQNLDEIRTVADETAGNETAVTVDLTREVYPTREYDSFTLPAGEYWSLKIVLGDGQGKNWWCVVYPSLCRKASGAMEVAAMDGGFTQNEIRLITENTVTVKLKFKILEILKNFRHFS